MATQFIMSRPQYPAYGFVNSDTRLGEETLSPCFAKYLESYYDRAPVKDKAKCLELITSIRLGNEVKKNQVEFRPRTAMPVLRDDDSDGINPYRTTYKREYIKRGDADVLAIRPMTSQAYTNTFDLGGHIGNTTYTEEYHPKESWKMDAIRSGTASGSRRNNPHPSQAFMKWKLPSNQQTIPEVSEAMTVDRMNQVYKRMCSSTYQNDFMGVPQGFQVKNAYNLPPDWRDGIPHKLDTTKRYSYQATRPNAEVRVPITRYGSNKLKHLPARGTIPTSNPFMDCLKTRTTYDRHYNDNAGPTVLQMREISRTLGKDTLQKYYDGAGDADEPVAVYPSAGRLSPIAQAPGLDRISDWPGPIGYGLIKTSRTFLEHPR